MLCPCTREKIKWFSFCKSVQPWSVICQHCGGSSSLVRTECFQGMLLAIEEWLLFLLNEIEWKLNLRSQVGLVRSKEIPYFRWETYILIAYGLWRFYGTDLKEMVFPCLRCFGIWHCRFSVRLHFSFHTNVCSGLIWWNRICFAVFLISYNILLFSASNYKETFVVLWAFSGPLSASGWCVYLL